jgi:hypothetical protein
MEKVSLTSPLHFSMEEILLSADQYRKLAKAVYVSSQGTSDLSQLDLWLQPLSFYPGKYQLHQSNGGPCGFFAAIQAHILLKKMQSEDSPFDPAAVLKDVVLDIFAKISPTFVFCTGLDTDTCECSFSATKSREDALAFLTESQYLNGPNACLLLAISFVFAHGGLTALELPDEPFIEGPQWTTTAFAWLMIVGAMVSQSAGNPLVDAAASQIGLRVLQAPSPALVGTWLNPDSSVFVCKTHGHFFAVVLTEDGMVARYDSMNPDSPSTSTKEDFHW